MQRDQDPKAFRKEVVEPSLVGRRRLVQAGLASVPVLLTLRSRSAWGQTGGGGTQVTGANGTPTQQQQGQGLTSQAFGVTSDGSPAGGSPDASSSGPPPDFWPDSPAAQYLLSD